MFSLILWSIDVLLFMLLLQIHMIHLQIVDLVLEESPRIFWSDTLTRWSFFEFCNIRSVLLWFMSSVDNIFSFWSLAWSSWACSAIFGCSTRKFGIYGIRNAQSYQLFLCPSSGIGSWSISFLYLIFVSLTFSLGIVV